MSVLGLYRLFLSYHSHSASTFQQMPAPLTFTSALWPPIIKRPPPSATRIPWSPISKAGPFLWADAEVEALRGRNVERRYQGSVRWRSHEGHGSLGGWAMSRGAWRAEAGLSHRPAILQSASQWCSAEAKTAIRQALAHKFHPFIRFLTFFSESPFSKKGIIIIRGGFVCISVPLCVWCFIFVLVFFVFFLAYLFVSLHVSSSCSDIILIKIKLCSLCVDAEQDQPCLSVAFPSVSSCCLTSFPLLLHLIRDPVLPCANEDC